MIGCAQKFLEDIVGEKAALRGEPHGFTLEQHETAGGELLRRFESARNRMVAKFVAKCGNGDSTIEAEAKEPCLFLLALGGEPGGFGRLRGFEIGLEIGCRGGAEGVAGLAVSGGGFAQHGRGIEAESEIGAAFPIAQVVEGLKTGAGEVGDFVLVESGAGEGVDGAFVHAGDCVVGGDESGVIAGSAGEELAAEAGLVVDFEHVKAGVGNAGGDEFGEGLLPGEESLSGKAGDEIKVEVGDAGGAETAEVVEDDGAVV